VGRRWLAVTLTVICLVPFIYRNVAVYFVDEPSYNVRDGMVRAVQTSPGKVLLLTRNDLMKKEFGGDQDILLERMYRLAQHTIIRSEIPAARGDFDRTVCFSIRADGAEWGEQIRNALAGLCPGRPVQKIAEELDC